MTTPTTRRYPRSTSEAFADERAYCVEVYRPRRTGKWVAFLLIIVAGLLGLAACGGGDPEPEPVCAECKLLSNGAE